MNLSGSEAIKDIAGYLELWVDAAVVRHPDSAALAELADWASFPIVNAMTDREHPCEVLADTQTLRERHGSLEGLDLVFVGAPTNVFASWRHLTGLFPLRLTLVCPEEYAPAASEPPQSEGPGEFSVSHDLRTAVRGADAVLTDGWPKTDDDVERGEQDRLLSPYRIDSEIMALAKRNTLLLPCPPVTRGQEVSDEVMDSAWFAGYRAKENLLHAQKAVLLSLLDARNRS